MIYLALGMSICSISFVNRNIDCPFICLAHKKLVCTVVLPLLFIITIMPIFLAYYFEGVDNWIFFLPAYNTLANSRFFLVSSTCGDYRVDDFISRFLLILFGLLFCFWHLADCFTLEQFFMLLSAPKAFLMNLINFVMEVFVKFLPLEIISFINYKVLEYFQICA